MIGVVLYTLMEFLNFYLAYKIVLRIQFTKRKWRYAIVAIVASVVQLLVLHLIDDTWQDVIIIVAGLIGAIFVSESKRFKTIFLYPIACFLPSLINIIGSFIVAAILGIAQKSVIESEALVLLCECTAIIVFAFYGYVVKKKKTEELSLTVGQYIILLIGVVCFFIIITFSQGLVRDDLHFISEMKDLTAVACVIIAFFFVVLSIWQQITWGKAYKYRMDNEKYEMFLTGQEEHIRMLIIEDEKRRKLRHDMNAHMLALNTMVEKQEWDMLREYLQQMQESLGDAAVNKYTGLSAVDAIISDWHNRAIESQVEWTWEGTLSVPGRVSIFELCVLFSNLLSNAVEAVQKLEQKRRINIKVLNFQGKIVLSVGNSCEKTDSIRKRPKTTKGDDVFHGLGLKNVEEIIKKYEGSIHYEMQDGWFQVDIVL